MDHDNDVLEPVIKALEGMLQCSINQLQANYPAYCQQVQQSLLNQSEGTNAIKSITKIMKVKVPVKPNRNVTNSVNPMNTTSSLLSNTTATTIRIKDMVDSNADKDHSNYWFQMTSTMQSYGMVFVLLCIQRLLNKYQHSIDQTNLLVSASTDSLSLCVLVLLMAVLFTLDASAKSTCWGVICD